MNNIIQVSGGKDSTATLLWALERGVSFVPVFCDTGWEAKETYEYLEYLESALDIKIVRLYPKHNFVELAIKKSRFPSSQARFCTEHLKIRPFVDYLLTLSGDFKIYQGIRGQESKARSEMNVCDDYFKLQRGDYALRKVKPWLKAGNTAVAYRPIFDMTHDEVFELHKKHNIKPNPLYLQGFGRVGCMPCIMCTHSELKLIAEDRPDDLQKVIDAENLLGRTFFPPKYISGLHMERADVIADKLVNKKQTKLFAQEAKGCKSHYNICE